MNRFGSGKTHFSNGIFEKEFERWFGKKRSREARVRRRLLRLESRARRRCQKVAATCAVFFLFAVIYGAPYLSALWGAYR